MKTVKSEDFHVSPDAVLEMSIGDLQQVVVCGVDNSGQFYLASSEGVPSALFLVQLAGKTILEMAEQGEPRH